MSVQVQRVEVTQILDACRELDDSWFRQVKLTFVVVQKRHHTRIFPANPNNGQEADRSGNVLAGALPLRC